MIKIISGLQIEWRKYEEKRIFKKMMTGTRVLGDGLKNQERP